MSFWVMGWHDAAIRTGGRTLGRVGARAGGACGHRNGVANHQELPRWAPLDSGRVGWR